MGIFLLRKREILDRHLVVSAHVYQGQVEKYNPLQFTKDGIIVVRFQLLRKCIYENLPGM